jgi:phosphoglycolate phosphatase-like HAD superfamily hydrolase/multidrug transporter EmrE-like cation transporter
MNDLELLVFDLDGVITSEQKYWNTSRLTVWEILCRSSYIGLSEYFGVSLTNPDTVLENGEALISTEFIAELKNRAVNSNWDLTFFVVSLHIIGIVAQLNRTHLATLNNSGIAEQLQLISYFCKDKNIDRVITDYIIQDFWKESIDLKGTAVQEYVPVFAQKVIGQSLDLFRTDSPLWQLCYENFQAWYEGQKGYQLPDDETVLPVAEIQQTLAKLAQSYKLAIATGRPRNETIPTLTKLGLIEYFAADRIVTYDEVITAEKATNIRLGKPHPFIVLKAIYPQVKDAKLVKMVDKSHPRVAYIGDAASDVVAAKAAGCHSIGVLTGFGMNLEYKQQLLSKIGCDNIITDVMALPGLLSIPTTTLKTTKAKTMSTAWIALVLAGIAETGWPVGLKISQQPDKTVIGIVIALVCLAFSGTLLWFAQKEIPIGTSYAVWTGMGAAGTFLIGVYYFGDATNIMRFVAVGLIVTGVILLKSA